MNDPDVEALLRVSLRHHADQAPPAGPVSERVLAHVAARRPRRHWRPWVLPLAAAAAVIVTSVALTIGHQRAATPPATPIGPATSPVTTHATATVGESPTVSSVVTSSAELAVSSSGMPAVTSSAAPEATSSALTAAVVRPLGIHMVTATAGWALADAGLLYTTDGGESWAVRTPPGVDPTDLQSPSAAYWPRAATFAGAEELWIAVDQDAKVTVFHTTDAGRSWSSGSIAAEPVGLTSLTALGLSFPTTRDGWLLVDLGAGGLNSWPVALYRTTDAGATWELVDRTIDGRDSPSGLPEGGYKAGFGFATPDRGWIAGSRGSDPATWLYETTDAGRTWTRAGLPAPDGVDLEPFPQTYPPRFTDDGHGVLPVERQLTEDTAATVFYITDDGGVTWRPTAPLTSPNGMGLWDWSDAAHGAATDGATWCVTGDGAASWQCDPLPAEMRGMMSLSLPTPDLGWASVYGQLYRTTDGGSTWTPEAVRVTQ